MTVYVIYISGVLLLFYENTTMHLVFDDVKELLSWEIVLKWSFWFSPYPQTPQTPQTPVFLSVKESKGQRY